MEELTGDRLREARESAGYTQRKLGDLLGVSGAAVGHWETGTAFPSRRNMQRLREILYGEVIPPAGVATAAEVAQLRADMTDLAEQITALRQKVEAATPVRRAPRRAGRA